ncbi:MAG: tryptophan-rich sensory protein [Hyphomonadaceae bacterium]
MATTLETQSAPHAAPPWDRPDALGLTLSMVIPLAAVVIGNGLIYASGSLNNPDYEAVSWGPPGWLIGAIWCAIYPLWGAARWKVAAKSDAHSGRSWWLVALIVWGLCYPVVTAFTGTAGSVVANVLSLALAIVTIIRVWPASMAAVGLIAPSILWLCVANAFGFAALEGAS